MVPAPANARQITTRYSEYTPNTEVSHPLSFSDDDKRAVPAGHFAVITHGCVRVAALNDWTDLQPPFSYELASWRIQSLHGEIKVRNLAVAYTARVYDYIGSASGLYIQDEIDVPSTPMVAPVVFHEGEQARVVVDNTWMAQAGIRYYCFLWVTGFVAPVVNDVPGNRRYFTERLS